MAVGKVWQYTATVPSSTKGTGYVTFYFEEHYDAAANVSYIHVTRITVTHSKFDGYYYSGKWTVNATITADGVSVANGEWNGSLVTAGVPAEMTGGTFPIVSGVIAHNATDGTKTVNLSITINTLVGSDAGWIVRGVSSSQTVALTTIPRLSEISAGNGALGTEQTLTVDRKASSYTHTIAYMCGSASGTICTKSSATSIKWTPPVSLASQNTTGTSVSVKLTITTYSGSTAIGSKEKTITCVIPDSVALTVSEGWVRVQPYNSGTAAEGLDAFVQGYSRAQVIFDAEKISTANACGAQIAGYRITCGGTSSTDNLTGVLHTAGENKITCTVTDTRGRSVSQILTVTVEAYKQPTLSEISVFRCNQYGEETDEGTYVSVTAKGSISEIGGLNSQTLQCEVGSLLSATLQSGITEILGGGGVQTASTYKVKLTLTDKLGNTATYTQLIPTADVMFHGRAGGKGAAFGKYAEADDLLDVNWSIRGRKNMQIDGALTMGNVKVSRESGDTYFTAERTDTGTIVSFGVGSGGVNHGIWSNPLNKWMIYSDGTSVYVNGKTILNWTYPVGAVYMSTSSTSPASLFGGTWTKIEGRFLFASNSSYAVGATGGSETHALTESQMPSHAHGPGPYGQKNWVPNDSYSRQYFTPSSSGFLTLAMDAADDFVWGQSYTVGGGAAHNNMPPYYVVYMWRRTA